MIFAKSLRTLYLYLLVYKAIKYLRMFVVLLFKDHKLLIKFKELKFLRYQIHAVGEISSYSINANKNCGSSASRIIFYQRHNGKLKLYLANKEKRCNTEFSRYCEQIRLGICIYLT